jgi:hypothetical protein
MKIKMLRSKMGSNDGHSTHYYQEGEEYDVSDALAESFIGERLAEAVAAGKADAAPENKAIAKAPKNKADAAPENKGD